MPAAFGGMRREICAYESATLPRHDHSGTTLLNQCIIVCWTNTACQDPNSAIRLSGSSNLTI